MSVKDIKEYYEQVARQYSSMLSEIKDFEKEAEEGLMEPERLDKIKETLIPLKNNYQTLSWIMYLLNKPVRKKKHKGYERQNKKLLSGLDKQFSKEGIMAENERTIKNLNDMKG